MQPRLTRSRTDAMLAGVCGGLGEYFGIDPTIVRFIFVIVMLTSGLALPVYLVLWLVMPRASVTPVGAPPQVMPPPRSSQFGQQVAEIGQQIGQEAAQIGQQIERELRHVFVSQRSQTQQRPHAPAVPTMQQPPDPSMYQFDPITGEPLHNGAPSTGQTINLHVDPHTPIEHYVQHNVVQPQPPVNARRHQKNWRTLGLMLVGIGALIIVNRVFGSLDIVFPLVFIVAGLVMLRRH